MLKAIGHRRPSTVPIVVASAVLALAVALVLILSARSHDGDRNSSSNERLYSSRAPEFNYSVLVEQPLDGGVEMTLEEARGKAEFEVPAPHDSAASRENMDKVFYATSDGSVAEVFSNSIVAILETSPFKDGAAAFSRILKSAPNGKIVEVNGSPALLFEPGTDPQGDGPGSLEFIRQGVAITIYGEHSDGKSLMEIAESMQDPATEK